MICFPTLPVHFAYGVVLQEVPLGGEGVLTVSPFHCGSEEESQLKMLEILGGSKKTELSYLLSNVRKQPRQP